jgi:N-methylhydantoinase A
VLIERGLDPRDFTLLAFGGAGPLHAAELMVEMGIPRAIVPNHPGQFSAYGFIQTDARVDRQRTTQLTSKRFDPERATLVMQQLAEECLAELRDQGYSEGIHITRALEMRYLGQNYELELPVAFEVFTAETTRELWRSFHEAHHARFGFSIPGEVIEIVNYLTTAVSVTPKPELERLPPAEGAPEVAENRDVRFQSGVHPTPVFRREALRAGHRLDGPAIVEEAASVTVLNPGQSLAVDDWGHLIITGPAA